MRVFPYAVKVRWGGLRLEPYKPNAVDADHDGIIQEETIWERPAGARILDGLGKEIASGINPPSGDPFNFSAREGWRIVDADGKDIDYTPTWEKGGLTAPDVTGPAGPSAGGGRATVGDRSPTVGDRTGQLSVGEQEKLRAQNAAADLAEAQAQSAAGADRGGKPLEHDPYVRPTDEAREIAREGIAAARETMRGTELGEARPAEVVANRDIVWDEAGRKWVDLSTEEKVDLIMGMIRAAVRAAMQDPNDAGHYVTLSLHPPDPEEHELITDVRQRVLAPVFRAKLQAIVLISKFKKRLGYRESPNATHATEQARVIRSDSADFFRTVYSLLQNMGINDLEVAKRMIRDGFELPGLGGRKVFLRGQPVPSETQTPRSPSGKSDLGYADEVIVRNGKGVVPIHPDDIPVDELNGMIHNADSDIPLEIIVRALRTALDEDDDLGHEAERRLANEAMIEVRDVIGPSIMEAVEVEYEKQLREGAAAGKQVDEDSLLARLLGRTVTEATGDAESHASGWVDHSGKVLGHHVDGLDTLHLEHDRGITTEEISRGLGLGAPNYGTGDARDAVLAERLNAIGARVAERVLGHMPEWAKRGRLEQPVDPDMDPGGRGVSDAPLEGATAWPLDSGRWNGSPEYLFQMLIQSLAEDVSTGRISTEEFAKKINGLEEEVTGILKEEIATDAEQRMFGRENLGVLRSSLDTLISEVSGDVEPTEEVGQRRALDATYEILADALGVPVDGLRTNWSMNPEENHRQLAFALRQELRFRSLWVERRSTSGDVKAGQAERTGELIPGRAWLPYLLVADERNWVRSGYLAALTDALAPGGTLAELVEQGRFDSIAPIRERGLIIRDILHKFREFAGDDIEKVEAALAGIRTGPRGTSSQVRERRKSGTLTSGEETGAFDHHHEIQMVLGEVVTTIERVDQELDQAGLSDERRLELLQEKENIEHLVMEAIGRGLPLDWIRAAGLSGPFSIETSERRTGSPGYTPPDWVQVTRSAYSTGDTLGSQDLEWQPWGRAYLRLNPVGTTHGLALHEFMHRVDAAHPLFRPLVWAFVVGELKRKHPELEISDESTPKDVAELIVRLKDLSPVRTNGLTYTDEREVVFDLFPMPYAAKLYPSSNDPYFIDRGGDYSDPQGAAKHGADMHPLEVLTVTLETLLMPEDQRYHHLRQRLGEDQRLINFVVGLLAAI